jgi:phytoene dehydrogenase-like protein
MILPKLSKPSRGASYDALVAGAGLSGLFTAALLLKKGSRVHLAEKMPVPGGRYSPELREGFAFGSGFAFGDSAAWRALADRLGLESSTLPVTESKPLVFGSRGWVDPEELPDWEMHLARACTEFPQGGLGAIVEKLLTYCSSYDGFSYSQTPITALIAEGNTMKRASLGADTEVSAQSFYWAADYKNLLEILQGPGVPEPGPERVSWLKKFVKTNPQPGVVLEFAHKNKLGDFSETLLLPFSAGDKEERRYLVGAIVSNRDASLAPQGKSLSSWIFPLTEAEWGDNHESMKKIRSARRLLEKAFQGFEPSILSERVLVLDSTVAPLKKRKGEWSPPFANLQLTCDWAMPNGATLDSLTETLLEKLG